MITSGYLLGYGMDGKFLRNPDTSCGKIVFWVRGFSLKITLWQVQEMKFLIRSCVEYVMRLMYDRSIETGAPFVTYSR